MNNILILLLAGASKRFNYKTKKQFITINNKPLYCYSLDTFLSTKKIEKVLLVINKNDKDSEYIKFLYANYKIYFNKDIFHIVYGGKERYNSVYNALQYLKDNNIVKATSKILIHDSSRPFVTKIDILNTITALDKYKSVTLAQTVTNTIKIVKNIKNLQVDYTPDRKLLYEIYTPQGFIFKYIYDAYNKFMASKKYINITDDLQIIEMFSNVKSYLILGDRNNIKITYRDDIDMFFSYKTNIKHPKNT